MVHDVRQRQLEDEPPEHAQCQSSEERATGGDDRASLERPEDETPDGPQHDEQEKAGPTTESGVSNRDAEPV